MAARKKNTGTSLRIVSSCVTHACNALMTVYQQMHVGIALFVELRLLDLGAEPPRMKLCWVFPGRTRCYIREFKQIATATSTTAVVDAVSWGEYVS